VAQQQELPQGGAVGALVGLGTPEYEAKAYEERIKEGGYLIAVHAENGDRGDVVRDIMKRNGLEDVSQPLKNSKRQRFACP
jgi:hypothetical protein